LYLKLNFYKFFMEKKHLNNCWENSRKNKKWFTLIELLLVLFILSLWIVWASTLNFNTLSDKQKLGIFSNKIITAFEEIRGNSLLWKWIWVDLEIPEKWKIEFLPSWSGSIKTYYNNGTWVLYENINIETNYKIKELVCSSIDESFTGSITSTWIIEIEWKNLTLTWACNDIRYKKLQATLSLKSNFEKTIEINIINWLIESVQ
jgi:hypothetical protein